MSFLDSLVGISTALVQIFTDPLLFSMIVLGMVIGLISGALPGITMVVAMVLVLPFTLNMAIGPSIVVLFSIYCGGVFGGSIIAILFNIPGDPMNVCTCFDGHAMAKKGEGGKALSLALYASTLGGMLSALMVALVAPPVAELALKFSCVEFFAVVFLGLCAVSVIGESSVYLSITSLFIGIFLGTVGVESITGAARFTFASPFLIGGINWVAVLIGMFAVGEVLEMYSEKDVDLLGFKGFRLSKPKAMKFKEFWELRWVWVRSYIVGSIVGIIPAAGAAVASFIGYGIEKQVSKHPEKFGTGVPEGIAAPECANNASTGGAMIPLLTLGIPGSAATAVMLGVFLVQGIQPGPSIFINMPEVVFLIFAGGIVVNALMFVLGRLMIVPMVKLMDIPKPIMSAFILVFSVIGAFSLRSNMLDVWVMVIAGLVSYIMRRYDYPTAPLVLGLILGPMAEDKFMTSMYAHGNDFSIFFTRPISGAIMVFSIILLFTPFLRQAWGKSLKKKQKG